MCNICEMCGNPHDGLYKSGRFCTEKCARGFSTKMDNKKQTKIVNCPICGVELIVNKRSGTYPCELCNATKKKKTIKSTKSKKYCKVCGEDNCHRPDICKKRRLFPSLEKYFGFDISKIGTTQVYEEYDRVFNILIEDYVEHKLSTIDMAHKYNHSHIGNFNKILNSVGIPLRTLSNAVSLAILNNKIPLPTGCMESKYKNGWHIGWDGEKHFYRSSYELDYYKILDEQQVEYKTEKLRILYWNTKLYKQLIAIPDIYIPSQNLIVEIKSDYTYDKQSMDDKVRAYKEHGYKFKLILEHKEMYP